MICISTFLTCSLYLLYLLLNSCGGNDAFWRHSMLVKQSSSFSRKHWTLSVDLCPSNSPVDYRICGLVQECVYNVQTPICDTSHCDQRLEAASQWHIGKHMTKHYRQRCWSLEKAVTCNHEGKWHHFEHLLNWNCVFKEPTTVYRGKHVRIISVAAIWKQIK